MQQYLTDLAATDDDEGLLEFCRRRNLHGTPAVFNGDEDAYYAFRRRIADEFQVEFHEVFISGSAKLGFSPFKRRAFDLDSDIDVAIVSAELYDRMMSYIHSFQMALRGNRKAVSERELGMYHKFLEYSAIGWIRPDLLPTSFRVQELKRSWFSFFESISHGHSEVGNYKVSGGAFKSYSHLESYTLSGLQSLRSRIQLESIGVDADKT